MTHCPVCLNNNFVPFFELPEVPTQAGMLWKSQDEALHAPTGRIKLAFCHDCGFIGNLHFEPEKIKYDQDYSFSLFFSPTFREFLTSVANRLVSQYDITNKTVLEIACGEGDFLRLLCGAGGNQGIGIDPITTTHTEQVGKNQISFIKDLYTEKYADLAPDLICCRQALDQLPDPKAMLKIIRENIGDRLNTIVYVEVPNATGIFENMLIRNIMYEKSSWFTTNSLVSLFESSGFKVLSVAPCFDDDQYIGIEAMPVNEIELGKRFDSQAHAEFSRAVDDFGKRHEQKVDEWRRQLLQLKRNGQKILAWGSGAGGINFFSTLGIQDEIPYLIDINPKRQGKFMPITGQPVMPAEFVKEYKPDTLVITNSTYEKEIKQSVSEMGIECDFWVVK